VGHPRLHPLNSDALGIPVWRDSVILLLGFGRNDVAEALLEGSWTERRSVLSALLSDRRRGYHGIIEKAIVAWLTRCCLTRSRSISDPGAE